MDIRGQVYINLIHYPLFSLGPGKRVGLWFQGCDIRCKGCMSKHTWIQEKKHLKSVNDVINELLDFDTDAITISGGEPFNQSEALKTIIENIRNKYKDILLYTGYEFEYLYKNYKDIIALLDVVIDSPFDINLPTDKIYKGSKNQNMIILNKNLKEKYLDYSFQTKRKIQIINKDGFYLLGIPSLEDYTKYKEL